jgi:hypothetical protein
MEKEQLMKKKEAPTLKLAGNISISAGHPGAKTTTEKAINNRLQFL